MKYKIRPALMTAFALLVLTSSLLAGGIAIILGKPSANPEALAKHAVLVVEGYACTAHDKTVVTATAEGLVNGKRETIPLRLAALGSPSTYALTRQWPAEGKWVVSIVESNPAIGSRSTSALVRVDGDAVDWANVKRFANLPSAQNIEAALNTTTTASLK